MISMKKYSQKSKGMSEKKIIQEIADKVQSDYKMGGLSEGLYLDFATDVALEYAKRLATLPKGFPTSTKDIKGNIICLGDTVGYDFDDTTEEERFEVIFEENAFRKKYKNWEKGLMRPLIEIGGTAKSMRLIIIKKFNE